MNLEKTLPFTVITTSEQLIQFCRELSETMENTPSLERFITVDTEFLREKTYYAQLCLIQIAGPTKAAIIDPLIDALDLTPLKAIFEDPHILKVFHAARQDIEIIWQTLGCIPKPLFDTQVAAMFCGFGESIGYERLVSALLNQALDKTWQFTNWTKRPLEPSQVQYALGDVVYLRAIYQKLQTTLEEKNRVPWIEPELAVLTTLQTYTFEPSEAWRRLKPRQPTPRLLGILKEAAAWREIKAQQRNVPRNHVLPDDILLDLAHLAVAKNPQFTRVRGFSKDWQENTQYKGLREALEQGRQLPEAACPILPARMPVPTSQAPLLDLLSVLLKLRCEAAGLVPRLVATSQDLENFATQNGLASPLLSGWRREVFGEEALALKEGKLALTIKNNALEVFKISP